MRDRVYYEYWHIGISPDTNEVEIRESLEEFGAVINKITIQSSDKEGGYLAMVDVDTDKTGCKVLVDNINGKLWKGRKLQATAFLFLK